MADNSWGKVVAYGLTRLKHLFILEGKDSSLNEYYMCIHVQCLWAKDRSRFSVIRLIMLNYWRLNAQMHKYVYFGHFNITFQCTNTRTSVAKG
jgi:hypothetical protein